MIVLVALTGRALVAMASDGVHVVVTDTNSSFTAADPVCILTVGQLFTAAGDFVGSIFIEATLAQFADGRASFTDFETWTGVLPPRS